VLARTVAHFFPELFDWLGQVADRRSQEDITYGRRFLLWMGLMGFLLKLGSRRRLRFELDTPEALANLNRLSRCDQEAMAHSDTLNYFLGRVPVGSLPAVRRKMVQRLLRMKALDHGRLLGHFLVVIDGTGQLHFNHRHCDRCLTRTHKGPHGQEQTSYYHQVLEAKLITAEGLAISLDSEFIENGDTRGEAQGGAAGDASKRSPQDCELKAFARMAPRLAKHYPQLQLCLLLDGLYANGTAIDICQQNRWKYIISFKAGSLPALWADYQGLLKLPPRNRATHTTAQGAQQSLAWVEQLEHVDDQKRRHRINAFECREQREGQEHFFAWLTNFSITRQNVAALANGGGRCRWKIENEGFNLQKNGGFNLEHAYSTGELEIKNFYVLLQIAHLILQLIERGSLLRKDAKHNAKTLFGSLANLARRLGESIRNILISADAIDPLRAAAIQIRLNSS
jgi:hypothetical protein